LSFSAVIATILGKAIDQITRDDTPIIADNHNTKLIGLQRASINERKRCKSRCRNIDEIQNFSQLKPDDLSLLIILFQILDKNISEYDNILHDIRHIGEYIAQFNQKQFIFNSSNKQHRLQIMMNTLSII
jgi:hypothetical protein